MMAELPPLTPNAIQSLLAGDSNDNSTEPIIQCIGAKPLSSAGGANQADRYRLAISDGSVWCTAMLATQLNELCHEVTPGSAKLSNNAVFQVVKHLCSMMNGKRVIVILAVNVFGHAQERIGNPKQVSDLPQGAHNASHSNGNGQSQTQQAGNSAYSAGAYGYRPNGQGHPGNAGGYGQPSLAGGYGQAPNFQGQNAAVARNDTAPRQCNSLSGNSPKETYKKQAIFSAFKHVPLIEIVPIAALNAYQNRWTIKARISQRSEVRRWNNARGEGKFFSVDFLDASGGEIRAVAFNDVADKFDDILQMGKVVMVSKGTLKPKKPGSTFNQTRHDHEMTLEKHTIIQECPPEQDDVDIPQIMYRFRKIGDVESCPAQTQVDVIGVLETVGPATTLTKKDGTETLKRNFTIRDDSNRSIEVTMWGATATDPGEQLEQMVNGGEKPILAAKSLRVGDFNGKTLSTIQSTLLSIDPPHPAADALRDWFENQGGKTLEPTKLSENRGSGRTDRRCVLATIDDEHLGSSGQPEYITVPCIINMIKSDSAFYPACSQQYNSRPCNKKLVDHEGDGVNWFCERCQKQSAPDWRYILAVQAQDHTQSFWLTAFQEAGVQIMGMQAADLRELSKDKERLDLHMSKVSHTPFLFKIKVAEETYQQETRIKKTVLRADAFDFSKESRVLLGQIAMLHGGNATAGGPAAQSMMGGQPTTSYQGHPSGVGGTSGGYMAGSNGGITPSRGYGEGGGAYGGQAYGGQSYGGNQPYGGGQGYNGGQSYGGGQGYGGGQSYGGGNGLGPGGF